MGPRFLLADADDESAAHAVFLPDLYAIPEHADDPEDLTGSSWCSYRGDAHVHDDSFDADDELDSDTDCDAPYNEVRHSFVFRGAQHDTVRTIIRADPARALASSRSSVDIISDSESSLSGDSDDFWGDLGCDTPLLSETSCETSLPSPALDPLAAARSGAARIAAWQHLEEDLDFREHEWLLQQIGCGRVEIWVSEERFESTESVQATTEEHRPRVFFAPTLPRFPSVGGSS